MGKNTLEKPKYDFSYIKEISSGVGEKEGEILYAEIREILYEFEVGINLNRIISLFEKGFLVYLRFTNKLVTFFKSENYTPDIYELVLPNKGKTLNEECRAFLKNAFKLDYNLLLDVSKDDKRFLNASFNDKKALLTMIFKFVVTLTKLTTNKDVEMPPNELIGYLSFIETVKEKEIRRKQILASDAFESGEYDLSARYYALLDDQKMVDLCLRLFSLKILFQNLKSALLSKRDFVLGISKFSRKEFNIVKKHFEPFEMIIEMNEENKRVRDLYNYLKDTLIDKDTKFFIKQYNLIQKDNDKLGYLKLKMPEIMQVFDAALLDFLYSGVLTLKDIKSIAKLKNELFTYRIIEYSHDNIDQIDDEYLGFVKIICVDEKLKELFENEQIKRLILLTNTLFNEKKYGECLEKIIQLYPLLDAHERVECMYNLKLYADLCDLYKKDFYKNKICEFLKTVIHDDEDIKREINNFRSSEIELYIIKTYLLDKQNSEIYNSESVEHDSFFNEYQGSLLEYSSFIEKQYKTYNDIRKSTVNKARKTELTKTIVFSSMAFVSLIMAIVLLVLEAGLPFEEKATRVFSIVMCVLLTIISIGFATYHVFKLLKDDSKEHGLESRFNKQNDEYLKAVNENTYQYKIALFYGFLLRKTPFLKPYPVIRKDTVEPKKGPFIVKCVVNAIAIAGLVSVLSTHNIYIYNEVVADIYNFKSTSIKEFEWSMKKLPKDYKDIALIKGEYNRISKDLESAAVFTDKNDIAPHSKDNGLNIELNQTALAAFNNVQCFMYQNYDFETKNKYNKYSWDLYPLLNEINLYYLINGKTLKEANGGSGYLLTTPSSLETNIGDVIEGEFTYSFGNGALTLYGYESGKWVKKWTLHSFSFTSETTGRVYAESVSGYSGYFAIEY